ncbi:putative Spc97 / Spc98 family protein [Blattamonas nauphoetae]|uniref:Spc97 / Spc98 family protein n=1 Tax=Blattamonas nauphoetae TaxID=2049346 RepID=A0ABQ9XXA8_9EUKA|nr:putative Spc97 / Spc98 family protein [Blattamonas nauphoetae]
MSSSFPDFVNHVTHRFESLPNQTQTFQPEQNPYSSDDIHYENQVMYDQGLREQFPRKPHNPQITLHTSNPTPQIEHQISGPFVMDPVLHQSHLSTPKSILRSNSGPSTQLFNPTVDLIPSVLRYGEDRKCCSFPDPQLTPQPSKFTSYIRNTHPFMKDVVNASTSPIPPDYAEPQINAPESRATQTSGYLSVNYPKISRGRQKTKPPKRVVSSSVPIMKPTPFGWKDRPASYSPPVRLPKHPKPFRAGSYHAPYTNYGSEMDERVEMMKMVKRMERLEWMQWRDRQARKRKSRRKPKHPLEDLDPVEEDNRRPLPSHQPSTHSRSDLPSHSGNDIPVTSSSSHPQQRTPRRMDGSDYDLSQSRVTIRAVPTSVFYRQPQPKPKPKKRKKTKKEKPVIESIFPVGDSEERYPNVIVRYDPSESVQTISGFSDQPKTQTHGIQESELEKIEREAVQEQIKLDQSTNVTAQNNATLQMHSFVPITSVQTTPFTPHASPARFTPQRHKNPPTNQIHPEESTLSDQPSRSTLSSVSNMNDDSWRDDLNEDEIRREEKFRREEEVRLIFEREKRREEEEETRRIENERKLEEEQMENERRKEEEHRKQEERIQRAVEEKMKAYRAERKKKEEAERKKQEEQEVLERTRELEIMNERIEALQRKEDTLRRNIAELRKVEKEDSPEKADLDEILQRIIEKGRREKEEGKREHVDSPRSPQHTSTPLASPIPSSTRSNRKQESEESTFLPAAPSFLETNQNPSSIDESLPIKQQIERALLKPIEPTYFSHLSHSLISPTSVAAQSAQGFFIPSRTRPTQTQTLSSLNASTALPSTKQPSSLDAYLQTDPVRQPYHTTTATHKSGSVDSTYLSTRANSSFATQDHTTTPSLLNESSILSPAQQYKLKSILRNSISSPSQSPKPSTPIRHSVFSPQHTNRDHTPPSRESLSFATVQVIGSPLDSRSGTNEETAVSRQMPIQNKSPEKLAFSGHLGTIADNTEPLMDEQLEGLFASQSKIISFCHTNTYAPTFSDYSALYMSLTQKFFIAPSDLYDDQSTPKRNPTQQFPMQTPLIPFNLNQQKRGTRSYSLGLDKEMHNKYIYGGIETYRLFEERRPNYISRKTAEALVFIGQARQMCLYLRSKRKSRSIPDDSPFSTSAIIALFQHFASLPTASFTDPSPDKSSESMPSYSTNTLIPHFLSSTLPSTPLSFPTSFFESEIERLQLEISTSLFTFILQNHSLELLFDSVWDYFFIRRGDLFSIFTIELNNARWKQVINKGHSSLLLSLKPQHTQQPQPLSVGELQDPLAPMETCLTTSWRSALNRCSTTAGVSEGMETNDLRQMDLEEDEEADTEMMLDETEENKIAVIVKQNEMRDAVARAFHPTLIRFNQFSSIRNPLSIPSAPITPVETLPTIPFELRNFSCITLDFNPPFPLSLFFSQHTLSTYSDIFRQLFCLKYVSDELKRVWVQKCREIMRLEDQREDIRRTAERKRKMKQREEARKNKMGATSSTDDLLSMTSDEVDDTIGFSMQQRLLSLLIYSVFTLVNSFIRSLTSYFSETIIERECNNFISSHFRPTKPQTFPSPFSLPEEEEDAKIEFPDESPEMKREFIRVVESHSNMLNRIHTQFFLSESRVGKCLSELLSSAMKFISSVDFLNLDDVGLSENVFLNQDLTTSLHPSPPPTHHPAHAGGLFETALLPNQTETTTARIYRSMHNAIDMLRNLKNTFTKQLTLFFRILSQAPRSKDHPYLHYLILHLDYNGFLSELDQQGGILADPTSKSRR